MKTKPDLGFWKLWNLSFGFFGVQIAYALQSSQVSRIFSTIGADPHDLSYFWILPPLMGLIIQPLIGYASDRTWNRLGRRLPYLVIGAAIAIIVMCFLPNSGSLGLSVSSAILFGLVMLMFLDTSINMAMQPFKMLVGDMVNEKQKAKAYSIQSFLCNAGSVVGYVAPFVLAWFMSSTAPAGQVPPTVTWAFYLGAFILLLCVIYTFATVKEWNPQQYAMYNGGTSANTGNSGSKKGKFSLPTVFWTLGIVQFFCWAAFLYMWTYSTDALAGHAFHAPASVKVEGIQVDNTNYTDNYLFQDQQPLIEKGKLNLGAIYIDGREFKPEVMTIGADTIVKGGEVYYNHGNPAVVLGLEPVNIDLVAQKVNLDGEIITVAENIEAVSALALANREADMTLAHIASKDKDGKWELEETSPVKAVAGGEMVLVTRTTLNTESEEYQAAGDWNGVLLAFQGIIAVLWAAMLPRFRSRKLAYSLSLLIGGIGFLSIFLIHNQYLLLLSYGLAGIAWAAMLAMPFTILTNAISGGNIGASLGLFNCTICVPQIVAALVGGVILGLFPLSATGVTQTVFMLMVSGLLLIIGSLCVWIVKETFGNSGSAVVKPGLKVEAISDEDALEPMA